MKDTQWSKIKWTMDNIKNGKWRLWKWKYEKLKVKYENIKKRKMKIENEKNEN